MSAPVTTHRVKTSYVYAQLVASGRPENEIGTAFTVAKHEEFDRWLAAEKKSAVEAAKTKENAR